MNRQDKNKVVRYTKYGLAEKDHQTGESRLVTETRFYKEGRYRQKPEFTLDQKSVRSGAARKKYKFIPQQEKGEQRYRPQGATEQSYRKNKDFLSVPHPFNSSKNSNTETTGHRNARKQRFHSIPGEQWIKSGGKILGSSATTVADGTVDTVTSDNEMTINPAGEISRKGYQSGTAATETVIRAGHRVGHRYQEKRNATKTGSKFSDSGIPKGRGYTERASPGHSPVTGKEKAKQTFLLQETGFRGKRTGNTAKEPIISPHRLSFTQGKQRLGRKYRGATTARQRVQEAVKQLYARTAEAIRAATTKVIHATTQAILSTTTGKVVAAIVLALLLAVSLLGSCSGSTGGVAGAVKDAAEAPTAAIQVISGLDASLSSSVAKAAEKKTISDPNITDSNGIIALLILQGIDPTKGSTQLTTQIQTYYGMLNSYSVGEKTVTVTRKKAETLLDRLGLNDREKQMFQLLEQVLSESNPSGDTSFANQYSALVEKYAKKYGIEPAYIYATMEAESDFRPNLVSSAGASGLLQVMPVTFEHAKQLMKADGEKDDGYTYADIFKPEVNIKYAVRYFKYLKETFPKATIKTRAAAYNAGPGSVQGWLSNSAYSSDGVNLIYENIPFGETNAYVKKIERLYKKYLNWGNGTASGKFIWPAPGTTTITSGVGPRWGTTHNGIDISSGDAYGKPIVASDGGTVLTAVHSGWGGGYGLHVMIDHGNGYITVYGHASKVVVNTGDSVSKGQVIAYIGSTGDSTGPHLHFEIRKNGVIEDPEKYVSPS